MEDKDSKPQDSQAQNTPAPNAPSTNTPAPSAPARGVDRRGGSHGGRGRGPHRDNQPASAPAVGMESVDKGEKKLAFSTDLNAPGAPQGGGEPGGSGGSGGFGGRGGQRGGQGGRRPQRTPEKDPSGMVEQVIRISRVAKVTKGGTKLSFTALVVVGDGKGHAGYALGKAAEVAVAIKKGLNAAKKHMVEIPVYNTTIPHDVLGSWCATRVLLKPASAGTGVIAAGPVRAICDGAGIKNILTKIHRSSNPLNVVKATFEGLSQIKRRPVKEVQETK